MATGVGSRAYIAAGLWARHRHGDSLPVLQCSLLPKPSCQYPSEAGAWEQAPKSLCATAAPSHILQQGLRKSLACLISLAFMLSTGQWSQAKLPARTEQNVPPA